MVHTAQNALNHMHSEAAEWVADATQRLGTEDDKAGYHALRGVLFALRDRLPTHEAFDLSAQLPTVMRGIFFDGYKPREKPEKFDIDDFYLRVREELDAIGGGHSGEEAAKAVFGVIKNRISPGEVEHLRDNLPQEFQPLWTDA
jgi:uncharacterized protein (DUF2267 family)